MSTVMKHMPPVVVDEGDVTVLRRMAAYTWGRYAVTWPEGFEPPELAPDRELGFVAKLPTPEGGRFSRRFVRADAQVDAANGYSNVESILDEAEQRTGGDVFFERDITTAGLGRLVPRVHFDIGDIIPVRIWGRVIHLPVTSIDEVSEVGDRAGWRVHVGGQLISDRDALEADTSDLERVIAQERRERVDGDAAVMGVAEGAQQVSSTLDDDLDRSVEVVAGELGLPVPEKEHRLEVSLGEVLAQAIEATQVVQGLAFPQASVVPSDFQGRPWWAVGARSSRSEQPPTESVPEGLADYSFTDFEPDSGDGVEAAYIRISDKVDYKISLWMKGAAGDRAYVRLVDEAGASCVERWQRWAPEQGDWVSGGAVELVPDTDEPSGWGRYAYVVRLKPGTRRVRVSLAPGSSGSPWVNRLAMSVLNRPQEEIDAFQSEQIEANQAVLASLQSMTQRLNTVQSALVDNVYAFIDHEIGRTDIAQSRWVEVFSITVPVEMRYRMTFRIGWDAASRNTTYAFRVTRDGSYSGEQHWANLGPLFPWEDGYRTTQYVRDSYSVGAGETIGFWVRSDAPNASQRRIRDGFISLESLN